MAINILRRKSSDVEALVADLEKSEYRIERSSWDLIVISHYLQRNLIEPAKSGVKPGGVHHFGCDMERCPSCDGQLIMCAG